MHCLDNVQATRFGKFLADVADMAVDGAVADVNMLAISLVHDGIAAEHAVRLAGSGAVAWQIQWPSG